MVESLIVPYQAAELPCAKQVLVFAPHPDDEVFGPGGTLARYAQAGIPVHVVVLTDGAFGKSGAARLAWLELREAESRAAALVLGISPPLFWRIPDRQLAFGEALITCMQDAIVQSGADVVMASALTEMHPDHRVTGMAAVEAVRRLAGVARLAMYEVGVPIPSPSALIDISSVSAMKAAAMACFTSQLALQRYAEQIDALNRFRTYTLPSTVVAAEAFRLWDPRVDASPWQVLFESEFRRRQRAGLLMETGAHMPLLDVIICSSDHPLLLDALHSVACLTHGNVQVTVVNAKGGKHSALDSQCGPFPLVLLNQNGEALDNSAAVNLALAHCHGAFALFLDETQTLDPQTIALLLFEIVRHPHCAAAFVGASFSDLIGGNLANMDRCSRRIHLTLFDSMLFARHCPSGTAKDFSWRFVPATQGFEDWDFLLEVAQHGTFRNVLKQADEYVGLACKQAALALGEAGLRLLGVNRTEVARPSPLSPSPSPARGEGGAPDGADDSGGTKAMTLDLNARLSLTLSENEVLSRQLAAERRALEATTAALQQVLGSRSWLLTAPLRQFRAWWQGSWSLTGRQ